MLIIRKLFLYKIEKIYRPIFLFLLWTLCITISTIFFFVEYKVLPSALDFIFGHTFLLLFSIPEFFFIVKGIHILFVYPIFWIILFFLNIRIIIDGYIGYFCLLSLVLLISSPKWLIFSMAIMGI